MLDVDLARLDLLPRILTALQDLLRAHLPDCEIWAYGSRVIGGGHECSDLDIVLRPSATGYEAAGWLDLKEAVQQSSIPIIVDIHLWSHLPASFHREIEQEYVVLQQGRKSA